MNQDLEKRYRELFLAYDMGGREDLARVKRRLWENLGRGVELRSDAAFLLLTLYDQMILRPYAGLFITSSGEIPPLGLKYPVDQSLDALFTSLQSMPGEPPRSSHDVLKAIELTWSSQSVFFNWA